jgi:hypothetical protein
VITNFPLARTSAQIEDVLTKELLKYNFEKESTIFSEVTDPSLQTDISQLIEKSWGKKE